MLVSDLEKMLNVALVLLADHYAPFDELSFAAMRERLLQIANQNRVEY